MKYEVVKMLEKILEKISRIPDKIPLYKFCEHLPYNWTRYARHVRKGTYPVCYYSFREKPNCQYAENRVSRMANFLRREKKMNICDCLKGERMGDK